MSFSTGSWLYGNLANYLRGRATSLKGPGCSNDATQSRHKGAHLARARLLHDIVAYFAGIGSSN